MAVIDLDYVRGTQSNLLQLLKTQPWLRGIGITLHRGNYALKVNVDVITPLVMSIIPGDVDGVPVVVEAVGNLRAL